MVKSFCRRIRMDASTHENPHPVIWVLDEDAAGVRRFLSGRCACEDRPAIGDLALMGYHQILLLESFPVKELARELVLHLEASGHTIIRFRLSERVGLIDYHPPSESEEKVGGSSE